MTSLPSFIYATYHERASTEDVCCGLYSANNARRYSAIKHCNATLFSEATRARIPVNDISRRKSSFVENTKFCSPDPKAGCVATRELLQASTRWRIQNIARSMDTKVTTLMLTVGLPSTRTFEVNYECQHRLPVGHCVCTSHPVAGGPPSGIICDVKSQRNMYPHYVTHCVAPMALCEWRPSHTSCWPQLSQLTLTMLSIADTVSTATSSPRPKIPSCTTHSHSSRCSAHPTN